MPLSDTGVSRTIVRICACCGWSRNDATPPPVGKALGFHLAFSLQLPSPLNVHCALVWPCAKSGMADTTAAESAPSRARVERRIVLPNLHKPARVLLHECAGSNNH